MNVYKKIVLFLALMVCVNISQGQMIDTVRTAYDGYPGPIDYTQDIIEARDGGFLTVGYYYDSGNTNSNNIWLAKHDVTGEQLWRKTVSVGKDTTSDLAFGITMGSDEGYVISGRYNNPDEANNQVLFVKVDEQGDTLWTRKYGNPAVNEYAYKVMTTQDGGYAAVGNAENNGLFVLINADGDSVFMEYDYTVGTNSSNGEYFEDILQKENGNFLIGGRFYNADAGRNEALVFEIGSDGTDFGGKTSPATGTNNRYVYQIIEDNSDAGKYVLAGAEYTGSHWQSLLLKVDSGGNELWAKTYGGSNSDWTQTVANAPNGGFYIGGYTNSFGASSYAAYLVVTDSDGNFIEDRLLDATAYYDDLRGLLQTSTGEYVGFNYYYYDGSEYHAYLQKFDRSDFYALEALTNELDGSNWTDNTNWMSDESFNNWFGLTATEGRVTTLDLPANNMSGDLPAEVGELRFLENIDISDNNVSGSFDQFLDVTTLVNVNLNSNNISGSIPVPIGGATGMQTLRVKNNSLSGTLPAAMGNLTGLTVLDLSGNDITGSIPNAFNGLTNLDTLNLSDNNLSAKIPGALGSLPNLRYMDLSFNALPDTVPAAFKNLSSITEIRLNNNQLSGEVPSDLTDLNTLDRIYLNSNQLVDLPNLSSMTWISLFDVSDNLLTFEDLEPNVGITGFTYSPQDSVGEEENMVVSIGGTLELEVTVPGGSNSYQWYKDGEAISGQTSNTLSIGNVSADDAGVYHCGISNSVATNLTIYSQPANVEVYATSYTLNNSFSFPEKGSPNDYTPNDYRLIGLPGNGTTALSSIFTGEAGSDWVAYWDNGDPSTDPNVYLDEFDGSSNFSFTLGKAFWVINKGAVDMPNVQVSTAPLDGNNMATIPLANQGWVLITNPFTVPVSWSAVQAANGNISQPIYTYTGSQSSTMQPYTGYYFDNTGGLANLKIPYPGTGKVSASIASAPVEAWKITLAISKDDYTDNSAAFGISELAKPKHDDLDFRKPRTVGSWPSVYFDRTEWNEGYPIYATDMRPPGATEYRWDFNIVTGPPDESGRQHEVTLDFKGIEHMPEGVDVYLVDNVRFTQVNLKDEPVYSFMPDAKVEQFQVMVGNPDAVQQQIADALPTEFAFRNNYPNPFNPSNPMHRFTTIPVLIPEQTEVRIDIYNLRGQIVRTLFDGNVDPGVKNLEWDGTDMNNQRVASGVYICRMQNDSGVRESHKILVMK
ncbi:MAG: T9SS type A sorting domain-containing protein [Candidatus Marinimicrobia bacterium]|nr:T9SS type A sorting domain-containing protein [Candidatus Neomarinimicrobiota bacterium]